MPNSWEYMSCKNIQLVRESREAEGDFLIVILSSIYLDVKGLKCLKGKG